MSWDWQKALRIENPSAASPAATGIVSTTNRKLPVVTGSARPSSIIWRTTGLAGSSLAGASEGLLLLEKEYDCPFCRGRGELPNGGVCPICCGNKKVHVHPPTVKCAFCGGQGQMPPRSNMSCWVCKGKGLISVDPPVQICPDCKGRGKRPCESLYCPRCRGVGVIGVAGRSH